MRVPLPTFPTRRSLWAPTLLALVACVVSARSASSTTLFSDNFTYPNGNLVPNGGWASHSAPGVGPIQVNGNRILVRQATGANEDVNHALSAVQPATARTYASFKLVVTDTSNLTNTTYFATFRPAGADSNLFRARIHVARDSSTIGTYKIGISAGTVSATDPIVYFPGSYTVGSRHLVVSSYDAPSGTARLWVDPVSEASLSVSSTVAGDAGRTVASYAFRQGTQAGHVLTEAVDDVAVGTTFADALVPVDLRLTSLCVTDSTKQCGTTVFTNQSWHVMFTVNNAGGKDVDHWTFDLAISDANNTQTIPLKQGVSGQPLAAGQSVTVNWPSPRLFAPGEQGEWFVHAAVHLDQGAQTDSTPANDSTSTYFFVANKVTSPASDLALGTLCVTDSSKSCTPVVFTNQPWHVLFSAVNLGQKPIDNWFFQIAFFDSATNTLTPIKTQVPGVPLGVGQATTINWPMPLPFGSDQKGTKTIQVALVMQDPVNPDVNPNNNYRNLSFQVVNKGGPVSDLSVESACVTDTSKQCRNVLFTNQPWHLMFTARNVGQKPIDNWTFTIALVDSANGTTIPIKVNVPGAPLAVGQAQTINWPMPPFTSDQKGTWVVQVAGTINDPINPDANPFNNSALAYFLVRNKGLFSDLAVNFACVTDSSKNCSPVVYVNQPWHILFGVTNVGDKFVDNWVFDLALVDSLTGAVTPLKNGIPGPPLGVFQTTTINWPSPYTFAADQQGRWVVRVKVRVTDPTNPDGNPTNDSTSVLFAVSEKGAPVSDLAVFTVCPTDSSKRCSRVVYTNQPWHVEFLVGNVGQKPVDNWSYDIVLADSLTGAVIPIKTQIPGPPIQPGPPFLLVNWPSPVQFTSDQKGLWFVSVRVTVKDPTNPDANPGNNTAVESFEVVNKSQGPATDIAVAGVCAADTSKFCTNSVLTHAPWHILFNVRNLGQKPVDNWSFYITLIKSDSTAQHELKAQVPGPPLALGGTATVNWPSPYEFSSDDKGGWDIWVAVVVKEAGNPDTNFVNNVGVGHVVVDNPTATLLSLFQADPTGDAIELRWRFADAASIAEVRIERSDLATGPWTAFAPATRDEGGVTVATDRTVQVGRSYWYRLLVTTRLGERMTFGPLCGTAGETIREFGVSRVSPNPTSGPAMIEFTLPREAPVRLSIVDVQGRQMATLADGVYRSGRYQATWTGRTERGVAPVGVYLVLYQVPGQNLVKRLVLTR